VRLATGPIPVYKWTVSGPRLGIHENVSGLSFSPTMASNELVARLRHEGRRVFRLGLGQSPFPVPDPVVEELRASAPRKEYLPVRGLPALREAVAEYHRRVCGMPANEGDVLVGPGSKELLFLLQVVHSGDLLVPTPAWVSYVPQAIIVGRRARLLHAAATDRWLLRPAALDAVCRKEGPRSRVLVLNDPDNPTGVAYDEATLRELADVARRHGIVVLSDEIYAELHHSGRHISMARFYPEGTIISSGLSKWCGAGGWRLGTFTFPRVLRPVLEAMAAVASETYTSTSAPIQCAAVRAFQGGIVIERYLWHARRILAALARAMATTLTEAGAEVVPPDGAFYLFPDFAPFRARLLERGVATSDGLALRLLEDTGVAALPGTVFGRPPDELTLRLAFVDFDGARALAAAETLGPAAGIDQDFLRAYCGDMLEAAERIAAWAQGKPV
jgi:aspartate aminotransferase